MLNEAVSFSEFWRQISDGDATYRTNIVLMIGYIKLAAVSSFAGAYGTQRDLSATHMSNLLGGKAGTWHGAAFHSTTLRRKLRHLVTGYHSTSTGRF